MILGLDQYVKGAVDGALARLPESSPVVDYRCRIGADASGDDAVWLWLLLDDVAVGRGLTFDQLEPIAELFRAAIVGSVTPHGLELAPYIYFRSSREQRDLEAPPS